MSWPLYANHPRIVEFSNNLQDITVESYLVNKLVHDILAPLNACIAWKQLAEHMGLQTDEKLSEWLREWIPIFKQWITQILKLQKNYMSENQNLDVDVELNRLYAIPMETELALEQLNEISVTVENKNVLEALTQHLNNLGNTLEAVQQKNYLDLLL
jgi:hypothetical protein